ncbi:sigma factor [Paenibacillus tuaregi]|uniref:sigma factor n=1 Tax=Paenibacillus tuaregi TaxID=1816681 RepID=UPI0008382110|nr:sigma factor [Paenibacillus tuaregi]
MVFEDYFNKYQPAVKAISHARSLRSRVPREEFISCLNEELWRAFQTFDESKGCSLNGWVNRLLEQAAIRLIKSKEGSYHRNVFNLIDADKSEERGNSAPTLEPCTEPEFVEERVFQRMRKKEADQRQLIDFLIHSGPPDATTTAIVEAFKTAPASASDTAIAKSIGIHHETVKRKLRKLSRRYDANRFGDLNEYLAV